MVTDSVPMRVVDGKKFGVEIKANKALFVMKVVDFVTKNLHSCSRYPRPLVVAR